MHGGPGLRSILQVGGLAEAMMSASGSVYIHDITKSPGVFKGTLPSPLPSDLAVRSLTFSPNNTCLLAGAADNGSVVLWDMTHSASGASQVLERHAAAVTGLAFSQVEKWVLYGCGADGALLVWDVRQKKAVVNLASTTRNTCIAAREDGKHLAVGTRDGLMLVLDTRKLIQPSASGTAASSTPIATLDTTTGLPVTEMQWQCAYSSRASASHRQPTATATPQSQPTTTSSTTNTNNQAPTPLPTQPPPPPAAAPAAHASQPQLQPHQHKQRDPPASAAASAGAAAAAAVPASAAEAPSQSARSRSHTNPSASGAPPASAAGASSSTTTPPPPLHPQSSHRSSSPVTSLQITPGPAGAYMLNLQPHHSQHGSHHQPPPYTTAAVAASHSTLGASTHGSARGASVEHATAGGGAAAAGKSNHLGGSSGGASGGQEQQQQHIASLIHSLQHQQPPHHSQQQLQPTRQASLDTAAQLQPQASRATAGPSMAAPEVTQSGLPAGTGRPSRPAAVAMPGLQHGLSHSQHAAPADHSYPNGVSGDATQPGAGALSPVSPSQGRASGLAYPGGPPGASRAAARVPLTEGSFKAYMDDALEEMREGTRNLHIELLRQFHFQQVRASACGCGWSLQRRAASLQCGGAAPTPYATAGGEATLVETQQMFQGMVARQDQLAQTVATLQQQVERMASKTGGNGWL
ncbi:MAG: hypothetical protein WDW36_009423 [Sanguina aurantia]